MTTLIEQLEAEMWKDDGTGHAGVQRAAIRLCINIAHEHEVRREALINCLMQTIESQLETEKALLGRLVKYRDITQELLSAIDEVDASPEDAFISTGGISALVKALKRKALALEALRQIARSETAIAKDKPEDCKLSRARGTENPTGAQEKAAARTVVKNTLTPLEIAEGNYQGAMADLNELVRVCIHNRPALDRFLADNYPREWATAKPDIHTNKMEEAYTIDHEIPNQTQPVRSEI